MKKAILMTMIGVALFLTACTSKETKNFIQKVDNVGEITVNSGKKLVELKAEYDNLSDEDKEDVTNYEKYEEAFKKYHSIIYKELKKELETSSELEKQYYARYYDLNKFSKITSSVQKALDDSDTEKYESLYKEVKEENANLLSFIEEEQNKIYNTPTTDDFNAEFPFAVNHELVMPELSGRPLVKQTSNHPVDIVLCEAPTIDELPYFNLFVRGMSFKYYYNIQNIETLEISVQDENGEIQKALVNTQIDFECEPGATKDTTIELNERPAYLFINKDEHVVLALKNYDGEDFYVLYPLFETSITRY